MKRLFILGILCLLSLTMHAQRIAVLDFQLGTNVTEEEIDALTYIFRSNFNVDGYRSIPLPIIKKATEELRFNRTDMTRQQILKLSRVLEAKLVVFGAINKFMDEYAVDVSVLDVSTGLTTATEGVTFDKGNYRTAMEALAADLGKKLGNSGSTDSGSETKDSKVGYVDLGLSVKWASCNLGANKPEEYGDYYAWGETETKLTYDWSVYKWCNGSEKSLTKYNTSSEYGRVDNKTILEAADDVAKVKLGGKWRIPTDAEWTELRTKCTWTWTTQNGVAGYKVSSKINGSIIFLPAAGYRNDTSLCSAGSYGSYWSSSLNAGNLDYAWGVDFKAEDVGRYGSGRYYGSSVRPVSE